MKDDERQAEQNEMLRRKMREQQRRIYELERQVDYLRKRFIAAKQAVKWLESRFGWKQQDSFGT